MTRKTDTPVLFLNDKDMLFWKHENTQYALLVQIDDLPMNPRTDFDNVGFLVCQHPRYDLGDKDTVCSTVGELWVKLLKDNVPSDVLLKRLKDGTVQGFMEHVKNDFDENVPVTDEILLEDFYNLIELGGRINSAVQAAEGYVAALPVWIYDHSGITISCGVRAYPYDDQWDSGLLGWIAIPKEKAIAELGAGEDDWHEKAVHCMQEEISVYDLYLTGDVYIAAIYSAPDGIPGNDAVSDMLQWNELDTCGPFFGSDAINSGLVESVGYGLEAAVRSGNYETGNAETYVVPHCRFVRHNTKDKKG